MFVLYKISNSNNSFFCLQEKVLKRLEAQGYKEYHFLYILYCLWKTTCRNPYNTIGEQCKLFVETNGLRISNDNGQKNIKKYVKFKFSNMLCKNKQNHEEICLTWRIINLQLASSTFKVIHIFVVCHRIYVAWVTSLTFAIGQALQEMVFERDRRNSLVRFSNSGFFFKHLLLVYCFTS